MKLFFKKQNEKMNDFFYYLEFTSKNSLNRQELSLIEIFLKTKGLNFVLTLPTTNKFFGRVASGLKYDVGGGYDYKNNRATFVFCCYRGPKRTELEKEIEVLEFKNDSKKIFNWLKEKKYIHCIHYEMVTQGPHGDRINLAFRVTDSDDEEKREQLNLYELNLLLTKIFKIYLVDNAFKTSDNFKTDFFGTTSSRNILYKKFLIKYLKDFPGRPYRLIQNPYGYDDNKPKNLLRSKIGKRTIADSTISKYGLTIVPKKIYLKKIIENKVIDNFINILNDIEKEINHDIEIKKICLDFINDKINEKETKDKLTNLSKEFIFNKDEIIKNCLKAKNQKKEIEIILKQKAKKISFISFISKYIDFFNRTNGSTSISDKILKPSRSKELISNYQREIENIVMISKFIKDNDIKLEKIGENITLDKIVNRIEFIKNEALNIQNKAELEIEKIKEEIHKLQDTAYSEKENDDKLKKLKGDLRSLKMEIQLKENEYHNKKSDTEISKKIKQEINKLYKKQENFELEIESLHDKIAEEMDDVRPKINELDDKIEEKRQKNYLNNVVIKSCDFLIKYFFTEKTIKKYGYNSLKNMITDIYRSNLFHSREIKQFLFEMNIIKNNFEFYLFLN